VGDFSGQGAVVTGASSGVGAAVARALAAEGATVLAVGRDEDRLSAVASSAESVLEHRTELTDDGEVLELARRAGEELPGVDVLVHAAGVIEVGQVSDAALDDLDLQYRTNLRAPFALTQALLQPLRRHKGQIAFVNSTAGRSAGAGSAQYAATKHGLTALADSVRAEVNEDGVRVLSVFLGRTATPMQEWLHEREGRDYRPERLAQPEDVAQAVLAALRLPRTAEITEIAMRPMRKP
jgi:NADP-dependent 3-hydroxy acid dehydrogenase YdfG